MAHDAMILSTLPLPLTVWFAPITEESTFGNRYFYKKVLLETGIFTRKYFVAFTRKSAYQKVLKNARNSAVSQIVLKRAPPPKKFSIKCFKKCSKKVFKNF